MATLKAKPVPPPPNQYTAKQRAGMIEHILGGVACGRSVASILIEDEGMPSSATFWRWHMEDESLQDNLARCRENGIEALMEKARHIAENPMIGEEVTIERDPEHQKGIDEGAEVTRLDGSSYEGMIVKVKRGDMLGHRKLIIDTIIKQAQMLKPKTYGPKLDLTSGGEKLALTAELEAARRRAEKSE